MSIRNKREKALKNVGLRYGNDQEGYEFTVFLTRAESCKDIPAEVKDALVTFINSTKRALDISLSEVVVPVWFF